MDMMMSFCAQRSYSTEAVLEYEPSDSYEIDDENAPDSDRINCVERDLRKQCDNYRAQIKRQEQEINSYREHIETIEEEFTRLTNHLSVAEKNLRQKEQKLHWQEETINSLKNELDSFHILDKSAADINSSQSEINFSFSDESIIKMSQDENDSVIHDEFRRQMETELEKKLISCENICEKLNLENNTLKEQNKCLQKEINRLKFDNEDFRFILCNFKRDSQRNEKTQNFSNSTPIKKLNFISYKALELPNDSFSIDEDYDCENMEFIKKNSKSSPDNSFANVLSQEKEKKWTDQLSFSVSNLKDVTSIEDQNFPSCMIKNDFTVNSTHYNKCLLVDSLKNNICDVSSIEDEKFPTFGIVDFSSSSNSSKMNSNENTKKVEIVLDTHNKKEKKTNATHSSPVEESLNEANSRKFLFSFRSLFPLLLMINLSKYLKGIYLERKSIFMINIAFRLKLICFAIVLTILFWRVISMSYLNADLQTHLLPFYSIQEIFQDIFNQFYFRHF